MLKKISLSITLGVAIILGAFLLADSKYQMPLKVIYNQLNPVAKKEIDCLANNILFEAGHESEKGKMAVAFVTLNRVNSGFFPKTICDVVKQKTTGICQFSWYCEDRANRIYYAKDLTPQQEMLYNEIRNIAVHVYANYGKINDPTKGALFYHADYVRPNWKNMIHTATIGRHIFYIRKDML